jgi:hypothetical protein
MRYTHSVTLYYGKEAKFPQILGELAIEIVHVGIHSAQIEVAAGKRRKNIGKILLTSLEDGQDELWKRNYTGEWELKPFS